MRSPIARYPSLLTALHLSGPHTRAKSRLLAVGGQNPARDGLFAGGRWIRTSSTRAPVNRVIPLLCCPIAWDELARARVLLGSYDLTREEIWVNLIDRDRPHGLKEPARDPGGASVGVALPDDLDADRHAFDR